MPVLPPKPAPTPEELEARIKNLEARLESRAPHPHVTEAITQLPAILSDVSNRLVRIELERKLRTGVELFTVPPKVRDYAGEVSHTLRPKPFPFMLHALEIALVDPWSEYEREELAKLVRLKRAWIGHVDFADCDGSLALEPPALVAGPSVGVTLEVKNESDRELRGVFVYRYLELPTAPPASTEKRRHKGEWCALIVPECGGTQSATFVPPDGMKISSLEIADQSGDTLLVDRIIRDGRFDTLTETAKISAITDAAAGPDPTIRRFDLEPYGGAHRLDLYLRNPVAMKLMLRARILSES